MPQQLHIINGDDLSDNIKELQLEGEYIVWREMLCEGPTTYQLGTEEFLDLRKEFLNKAYQISAEDYQTQFIDELDKLTASNGYDEIVLWFEFDLFSHINMLAVLSHLMENRKNVPVFLVCSKKLKPEKEFLPLSQLPLKHLTNHYQQRISLNQDDLEMANLMWQLYNGDNPQKLISQIKKKTNFEYLSACIRAHLQRFPNAVTGLNSLERNVLELIEKQNITSIHHLMGYSLEYQGYFGLGDLQIKRILDHISLFFEEKDNKVTLTSKGKEALNGTRNFYRELKQEEWFGGVKKYDFLYDTESHKLLKL